jgi:hypothetical protein
MRVGPQNGRFRATMSLFSMFPTRARDRMYAYRKCEAMSSGYIIVPKPAVCLKATEQPDARSGCGFVL